jgi:hypothetical protein
MRNQDFRQPGVHSRKRCIEIMEPIIRVIRTNHPNVFAINANGRIGILKHYHSNTRELLKKIDSETRDEFVLSIPTDTKHRGMRVAI